tara:strand:+ start:811 stop:1005 length:195 start_codon:yes stop_codon:yes gene_type:complete
MTQAVMTFTNLKYVANEGGVNSSIKFTLNGKSDYSVSASAVGNKHYDEIMRQVAAGTITIADAD